MSELAGLNNFALTSICVTSIPVFLHGAAALLHSAAAVKHTLNCEYEARSQRSQKPLEQKRARGRLRYKRAPMPVASPPKPGAQAGSSQKASACRLKQPSGALAHRCKAASWPVHPCTTHRGKQPPPSKLGTMPHSRHACQRGTAPAFAANRRGLAAQSGMFKFKPKRYPHKCPSSPLLVTGAQRYSSCDQARRVAFDSCCALAQVC